MRHRHWIAPLLHLSLRQLAPDGCATRPSCHFLRWAAETTAAAPDRGSAWYRTSLPRLPALPRRRPEPVLQPPAGHAADAHVPAVPPAPAAAAVPGVAAPAVAVPGAPVPDGAAALPFAAAVRAPAAPAIALFAAVRPAVPAPPAVVPAVAVPGARLPDAVALPGAAGPHAVRVHGRPRAAPAPAGCAPGDSCPPGSP